MRTPLVFTSYELAYAAAIAMNLSVDGFIIQAYENGFLLIIL